MKKNLKEYQNKKNRIVLNEGGTGSGKTYGLAQLFAIIMMTEKAEITIARKSMPALKATAMKDFLSVLRELGIYRKEWHDKSSSIFTYPITGSVVDFLSVDDPMKVRSRRRDYMWFNEMNEFTKEDYRQISMRTNKQIYGDYNPSHLYHWIYDEVQTRDDCKVIVSTYKDNPFLEESLIDEIEGYKDKDANYWRVYGQGLRGIAENMVFTHWKLCDKLPEQGERAYWLDFGYNNPTSFGEVCIHDDDIYCNEIIYQRRLTNEDLIEKLKALGIKGDKMIYADSEDPSRIRELTESGFSVMPVKKGAGSVKRGIDLLKSKGFFITKNSVNTIEEVKRYCFKTDIAGNISEDPVAINDHSIDGIRGLVYTYFNVPTIGFEWL